MPYPIGISGNPSGTIGKHRKELEAALAETSLAKRKSLIAHCVERAYEDPTMAKAIMSKILPDLKALQVEGETQHTIKLLIQMPGQPGRTLGPAKPVKSIDSRQVPDLGASIIPPKVRSSIDGDVESPILAVLADKQASGASEAIQAPPVVEPIIAPIGTKVRPDKPTRIKGALRPAVWIKKNGKPMKGWRPDGQPDGRYHHVKPGKSKD